MPQPLPLSGYSSFTGGEFFRHEENMSLCGIDLGTTGCKAAAYSLDGHLLASAYREYPTRQPAPGQAELDASLVWNHLCDILRETAAATVADPITALSVSSMGEALVPVSSAREILGPALLCFDTRGGEYIDKLRERISDADFYRINPNILGTSYSLPKLAWIQDHQPDLFKQTRWFLPWADFVCYMLGAEPFTTASLACRTLFYDLPQGRWSAKILQLSGLEDLTAKLAPIAASGKVQGTIAPTLAASLGLSSNVQLISGGHDQGCNALGAGVCRATQAVLGLGTFACITPVFDSIPNSAAMQAAGLCIEDHIIPGKYVTFIYNQAGSLVKWFRDTFAAAEACHYPDIYDRLTAEMPTEPTDLFTLPYFEPTGPPHYRDAAGVIVGLHTHTSRGAILKSIMESATYYLADVCRVLTDLNNMPDHFIATGGGAKSDRWLQIIADIFGRPIVCNQNVEASALGAALLAGLGSGQIRLQDDHLSRFIRPQRRFEPNVQKQAIYQAKLLQYQMLVNRMLG